MGELMDLMMELILRVMIEKELVLTVKFPKGTLEPEVTLTTEGKETNVLLIQQYLATIVMCELAAELDKDNGRTLEKAIESYKNVVERGIRAAWGKEVAEE